jgi:hypothetical protein
MGALFSTKRMFTVLAPWSILAPEAEYLILQPPSAKSTAAAIVPVNNLIIGMW